MFIAGRLFGRLDEGHILQQLKRLKVTSFLVKPLNYIKEAIAIPKTIIETFAILNLWPSLDSKIIVDEI